MKNALVVVDVQNYYMNSHTKNLPEKIAKLIENSNFDFVVFTKFVNDRNSSLSKLLNWKECSSSPDTDIVKQLKKFIRKGNVFEKNTYSVFKSLALKKFLKDNKIGELFFCGLDADACILASAYDGFDMGYRVRVLEKLSLSHCGKAFEKGAMKIINKNLQTSIA